ncbi:16S rRNA (guanine(966)-N(2))-methyltransferase RsmD [Heliophilum fasciatum]|uniref:16S rRNA (Guanine(966)-N(2))-methyltransferase RsmD n=1 Tax=Heliophilum fasciatum TaxID=35700 RepID=A0A4R2RX33_9FIRM|nr:16S rRNA (guanine(966)-N(2))-methyltransferase RsmD [Heliophilum fasciatum]MCW2278406.1 16S rRNA (guanine(966)-N(2))-methyltransferase RsmD [Heliophilum fasciatum]TCP63695.1 16S rRNA (guanine(966)-N(2))-methyltransferase RsmD [Heliophilum fasciatum]
MRVIAGQARGHRLVAVKGWQTRPTTDRVREALFNVLGHRVLGAHCLDLYAGTGALGIEALSRGAAYVYWVEKAKAAWQVIEKNRQTTKMLQGEIVKRDVYVACQQWLAEGRSFDLIFADPPYHQGQLLPLLPLMARGLLAPSGTLVLESASDEELPEMVDHLRKRRSDRYGDTVLHYYQWDDLDAPQG